MKMKLIGPLLASAGAFTSGKSVCSGVNDVSRTQIPSIRIERFEIEVEVLQSGKILAAIKLKPAVVADIGAVRACLLACLQAIWSLVSHRSGYHQKFLDHIGVTCREHRLFGVFGGFKLQSNFGRRYFLSW